MKIKNVKIPVTTIVMAVILVVALVYVLVFFGPAQAELAALRADLAVANAEAATYKTYLDDPSILQDQIDEIQAQIDELNDSAYTNQSNVSLVISDAIQRFNVSLSSISLSSETDIDGNKALPLNLSISGGMENIVDFIKYFENNEQGSYLVRSTALEINGSRCTANLVIYLCTPNV